MPPLPLTVIEDETGSGPRSGVMRDATTVLLHNYETESALVRSFVQKDSWTLRPLGDIIEFVVSGPSRRGCPRD